MIIETTKVMMIIILNQNAYILRLVNRIILHKSI